MLKGQTQDLSILASCRSDQIQDERMSVQSRPRGHFHAALNNGLWLFTDAVSSPHLLPGRKRLEKPDCLRDLLCVYSDCGVFGSEHLISFQTHTRSIKQKTG
jgi:hypothetical protein